MGWRWEACLWCCGGACGLGAACLRPTDTEWTCEGVVLRRWWRLDSYGRRVGTGRVPGRPLSAWKWAAWLPGARAARSCSPSYLLGCICGAQRV